MSLSRKCYRKLDKSKPLFCALYLILAAIVTLQTPVAIGWQDALTESEISHAIELAGLSINAVVPLPTDTVEANKTTLRQNGAHLLGTQLLLVELKEQKKASPDQRMAEIFTYNYNSQIARLHIVDMQHRVMISVQDISSAHLPLSDVEIDYANWLLWSNSDLRQGVLREIENLQLTPSTTSTTLTDARVSVWVPGSPEHGASSGCNLQRCALFSLYTKNRDSLTIDPVVNLVTGEVFTDLPL